ncbi:MAG TPA: hypothetical protein VF320_11320 [Acidimicrobiales bacterium]
MGRTIPPIQKLLVATVAAGTLALGTAGVAGAAAPMLTASSNTPVTTTPQVTAGNGRLSHFSCARAGKALARIQKAEAAIAAGLPKLHAAESKATAAGRTRRAARIQKAISRLGRPGEAARLQRLATAIEAKCNVSAPAVTP